MLLTLANMDTIRGVLILDENEERERERERDTHTKLVSDTIDQNICLPSVSSQKGDPMMTSMLSFADLVEKATNICDTIN